jgi:hypothetical protein
MPARSALISAPSIDLSPTLSFLFDFAINRLVAARAAPRAFSTVADVTVQVTFVDYTGARHTVPGRVGMSLVDVAVMHELDMLSLSECGGGGARTTLVHSPTFTEDMFGEGPSCEASHVLLANEWLEKLPDPFDRELHILEMCNPTAK